MRLRRLKLDDWRGVETCEVRFGDGVTIVEGPNEAGKSTLVEALLTLIRELDSSKKQAIRAVMPVGRDVGSRVEAEIESGPYHFVYAKTYNKSPATTLTLLAPAREQLTGREAHERVQAILEETLDLALWEALLVEQGEKIAPADFQDSESLSHALDEAAGSAAAGHEDLDLFDAARAEYERYFTLKTGRAKFTALENDADKAEREHEAARAALAEVERDAGERERIATDLARRRAGLPELEAQVQQHEVSWQSVDALRRELELKGRDLDAARGRKAAAARVREERQALVAAIASDEQTLHEKKQAQQPLADRAAGLEAEADSAHRAAEECKARRNAARDRLDAAREDAACLEDLERLAVYERRLEKQAEIVARLKQASKTVNDISIDDAGLDALRADERALEIARQKRDLAATSVTVTAERRLDIEIDDESVSLEEGGTAEHTVAAGLGIRLPGIASLRITPPQSAAEIEREFADAGATLARALARAGVASLTEAIEQNEARRAAGEEVARLKSRAADVLGSETVEEIGEAVRSLRERKKSYLDRRGAGSELPETPDDARRALESAEQALNDADTALETAREDETRLRAVRSEADESLRRAREALIGLEATLGERQRRLEAARAEMPDDAVEAALAESAKTLEGLEAVVAATRGRLEELAPDSIRLLYTNAEAALERARRELVDAERQAAVLDDRLERARADGRFEALEAAERRHEDTRAELAATRRRAAAAERLWTTLNRHRDAARQAYVAPLKEAVERLGRIVFGPSFEVAIADDWTLESVTREATTLPFDALSIGAKEQLGILTRLAAARIVSEEGGVPLIIDDALGFSDPSRLETMGAAISAAGRDCQIIILTCTPGRFTHVGSAEVVAF